MTAARHILPGILAALMTLGPARAEDKPDPGLLHDKHFIPAFDAICGTGQKLGKGCDAIRARRILDAAAPPWSAIGRVNFASIQVRSHCTGTLVAEHVVLTASHCLYNFPRKSWIPSESIRFLAGYQKGEARASSTVSRYILDPVQDPSSRDFRANYAQDWALLVLDDPIGKETGVLPLQSAPQPDETFALAGYAGLRPHVLSLAEDCGPPAKDARLLQQTCTAMPGDSGAPLIALTDGKPEVIGVFSGIATDGTHLVGLGVPAATFRDALQALTRP